MFKAVFQTPAALLSRRRVREIATWGGGACWAKAAGWAGGVTEGGRNRPSKDLGMAGLKREVSSAFSDGRSEARV